MDPAGLAKGLISFGNLGLYEKAYFAFPPPSDYVPPKNNIAIHVLQNVLNRIVFAKEEYGNVFVNSQVQPHEDSSLKADLAINFMEKSHVRILCVIWSKGPSRSQGYSTKAVEEEALNYCKEFFAGSIPNTADFIYVCTLVGVHLRLWIVHRESLRLTPLWGSPSFESNEDYKDLGVDPHGLLILKTFHDMVHSAPQPCVGGGGSRSEVIPSQSRRSNPATRD